MSNLEHYIDRFLNFGHIDRGFPLYQYDGGQCSYTIHLSGLIHGNEVVEANGLVEFWLGDSDAADLGGKEAVIHVHSL